MVLYPQYRFELYQKIDEESHATTPMLITGFLNIDYQGGIEKTKDLINIKYPNNRTNAGSWTNFLGKANRFDNTFAIDDEIRFYAYYGTAPTPLDDSLILSGRISEFKYAPQSDSNLYTVKIINRTEELLNTMIPYSSRAATGSANTSPTAIKQMVNRLNQFNSTKKVFAYLETDTNPVTGSPGYLASTKLNGDPFPTIDYNETWKPVYFNIEKLSSPEYTEDDDAGEYIYYIRYSKVLPQYQLTYGSTINELVWQPKSVTLDGSFIEGNNITNIDISLSVKDIQNLLIVNAGTDKQGAGITGVAYDLTSIGQYGAKTGYYTRSRRVFSEIWGQEAIYAASVSGSAIEVDGLPPTTAFPLTMSFKARDSFTGSFNGSVQTANSKKEWNQYLRDEARWQAVLQANKVIERLGDPRYELNGDLIVGSNDFVLGGLYNFVVPSYGWEGTTDNPGYLLRVNDVQHSWNKSGWTTRIQAKEDEKVISEKLGNTKTNVTG